MRLKRTIEPTDSVVTLDVLREHLRLDDDDSTHDARLIETRAAATALVENYLNRPILTQTFEYRLDYFPWPEIELPVCPVQSVSSIQYVDTSGATQTWSASGYVLDNYEDNGRAKIRPAYDFEFPTTRSDWNVVTITFVAGWEDRDEVPASIVRGVLLVAGHFFENTEATLPVEMHEVPLGVDALLMPHRNIRFS